MAFTARSLVFCQQSEYPEMWSGAFADYRIEKRRGVRLDQRIEYLLETTFLERQRELAAPYFAARTEKSLKELFGKISSGRMLPPDEKAKRLVKRAQQHLNTGSRILQEEHQRNLLSERKNATEEARGLSEQLRADLKRVESALQSFRAGSNFRETSIEELYTAAHQLKITIRTSVQQMHKRNCYTCSASDR